MLVSKAVDKFCSWRVVERDATPRSTESYYRILVKLVNWLDARGLGDARLSDLEGRAGTELLRDFIGQHVGSKSASTRDNWISVIHSFFTWAEAEDLIEADPSRKIRRPPKRKPDVYRPSESELALGRAATTEWERAPWLLMEGLGLRAASVVGCRWEHVDLTRGRIRVFTKGAHWRVLPIAPDVLDELRAVYRSLEPEPEHYVFSVEVVRWEGHERLRGRRDPTKPASTKSLWVMTQRVCKRAGIKPVGPHALRHGFASRLLHQGLDVESLRVLMGHKSLETTKSYYEEMRLQEVERRLGALSEGERGFGPRDKPSLVAGSPSESALSEGEPGNQEMAPAGADRPGVQDCKPSPSESAPSRDVEAPLPSSTVGTTLVENPARPVMEAAGIEPALSHPSGESPDVTEREAPEGDESDVTRADE